MREGGRDGGEEILRRRGCSARVRACASVCVQSGDRTARERQTECSQQQQQQVHSLWRAASEAGRGRSGWRAAGEEKKTKKKRKHSDKQKSEREREREERSEREEGSAEKPSCPAGVRVSPAAPLNSRSVRDDPSSR